MLCEKLIRDYTGFDFEKIQELNVVEYLFYLRDAFIFEQNKTEAGREYLEKCYLMQQTTPDRQSLRNKFKKGAGNV
jgi:hypothetical protein